LAKHSQEKSDKLREVESGLQELHAKEKHISEEQMKNILLERELEKLKLEQTRKTWLLKNDIQNLEKSNAKL